MKGDVRPFLPRDSDRAGSGIRCHREMAAEQLQPDRPDAQAVPEQVAQFAFARIGRSDGVAGADVVHAGDVEPRPVLAGDVDDALDGSRHVEGGGDARQRQHPMPRPTAEPSGEMDVEVDDAGDDGQA